MDDWRRKHCRQSKDWLPIEKGSASTHPLRVLGRGRRLQSKEEQEKRGRESCAHSAKNEEKRESDLTVEREDHRHRMEKKRTLEYPFLLTGVR